MESDFFLNIEGSIGDLNHGRISLSDRLFGSLLGGFRIGGLGLLEHLLGRGERVDRLRRRRASEIFVRVEATNRGNVSDVRQLEEVVDHALVAVVLRGKVTGLVDVPVIALVVTLAVEVPAAIVLHPELIGHRWESHTFRQVGQRIGQLPLVSVVVVEAAVVAKRARLAGGKELALDSLEVGVDCAESSFSEIFWERLKENINQ